MAVYSQEFTFTAVAGRKTCVPLPCHMRGDLGRFFLKQIGGMQDGFHFAVYNRRGACANAIDLFVRGGSITSIGNNGSGKCRYTITAGDATGLKLGDTIEAKTTGVAGYNVTGQAVTAIRRNSDKVVIGFDTDLAYSAPATAGWWQTTPVVFATVDPEAHCVIGEQEVLLVEGASQAKFSQVYTDLQFENRDNQDSIAKQLTTSLYLEIEPTNGNTPGETRTFLVSYTASARCVTF